jgi:hypothetical protein
MHNYKDRATSIIFICLSSTCIQLWAGLLSINIELYFNLRLSELLTPSEITLRFRPP